MRIRDSVLRSTCVAALVALGACTSAPPLQASGTGGIGGGPPDDPEPGVRCVDTIDFGAVLVGTMAQRTLTCTNEGDEPVRVAFGAIAGTHPDFFAIEGSALDVPAGDTGGVTTTFTGYGSPGPRSAVLPVHVGGRQVAKVQLLARAIATPVEVEPRCSEGGLAFGYVPLGSSVEKAIVLRNVLTEPVEVAAVSVPAGFRLVTEMPLLLPAATSEGATPVEIVVAFEPNVGGPLGGTLEMEANLGVPRRFSACVAGHGGGPSLVCDASAIDFGSTVGQLPVERRFHCENGGTDDPVESAADNLFVELAVEGEGYAARIVNDDGSEEPPRFGYPAGTGFDVVVTFAPTAAGVHDATLSIVGARNAGTRQVALTGVGIELDPCALEALPPIVDWGHVRPGMEATLDVGLRNVGTSDCLIRDLHVAPEGDGAAFSLDDADDRILGPGEEARVPVTFRAPADDGLRTFEGLLRFGISHPDPVREVPLRARSGAACVLVLPATTTFLQATEACEQSRRPIRVINACDASIVVEDIDLAAGPGCPAPGTTCVFGIEGHPPLPSTLPPGGVLRFDAVHTGRANGNAAVLVTVQSHAAPYFAQLVADGLWSAAWTDTFHAPGPPKVDVLWVVDNSGSMSDEQKAAGASLPAFVGAAIANDADFQMAVTTTDVTANGERGRIVPLEPETDQPRIFTRWTPHLEERWKAHVWVGVTGSAIQSGLEAARLALSPGLVDVADVIDTPEPADGNLGFLRDDATLAVVFVSEEDDASPGSVDDYVAFFAGLKGHPGLVRLHGWVVGTDHACDVSTGGRYVDAIQATGGVARSLCSDTPEEDFAAIGDAIFAQEGIYRLTRRPACPAACEDAIAVHVDGAIAQPWTQSALGWRYDATRNAVVFPSGPAAPAPGQQVSIDYQALCSD